MNYHELTLFFDWVGPIVAVAQVKEAVLGRNPCLASQRTIQF